MNRLQKLTGLIVYAFPLGEADQIISCFTSTGNLVKFVAKGSRKVKSKSAAVVQLFVLGEYVIYAGRGLPILRQGDIVDSLTPLRRDWAKSGAAFATVELCRLLIAEEAREVAAFRLVMAYMLHLKSEAYSPIVFDSMRLKFVTSLGYGMTFARCAQCGRDLERGWMSWAVGGAVCSSCRRSGDVQANKELLNLLVAMSEKGFAQLQRLGHPQSRAATKIIDGLINWLTQGKTKAQAFRSLFES